MLGTHQYIVASNVVDPIQSLLKNTVVRTQLSDISCDTFLLFKSRLKTHTKTHLFNMYYYFLLLRQCGIFCRNDIIIKSGYEKREMWIGS